VGITDPTGDTTRYVYDAAGRRVQTRSTASQLRTELAYDAGKADAIELPVRRAARPLQRYAAP
jgi:YD repeat-containing protein